MASATATALSIVSTGRRDSLVMMGESPAHMPRPPRRPRAGPSSRYCARAMAGEQCAAARVYGAFTGRAVVPPVHDRAIVRRPSGWERPAASSGGRHALLIRSDRQGLPSLRRAAPPSMSGPCLRYPRSPMTSWGVGNVSSRHREPGPEFAVRRTAQALRLRRSGDHQRHHRGPAAQFLLRARAGLEAEQRAACARRGVDAGPPGGERLRQPRARARRALAEWRLRGRDAHHPPPARLLAIAGSRAQVLLLPDRGRRDRDLPGGVRRPHRRSMDRERAAQVRR